MLHAGTGCWCGETHEAAEVFYINNGSLGYGERGRRRKPPVKKPPPRTPAWVAERPEDAPVNEEMHSSDSDEPPASGTGGSSSDG